MTYRGIVKNGVIELDGPEKPPEGAAVDISLSLANEPAGPQQHSVEEEKIKKLNEFLLDLARNSEQVLPIDASINVDHYLYGHPKR